MPRCKDLANTSLPFSSLPAFSRPPSTFSPFVFACFPLTHSVDVVLFSREAELRGNCGVFCVSSHILHTLSQVDRHARAVHHGVCAVAEGLRGHSHPRDREGGVHSPVAGVSHPLSLGVFVHNSPSLRSL